MCRKQIITALAALSLSANALAGEFSDASAVSQRLQFIAGAVEFGFDLKALEVNAGSQGQMLNRPVATFEVTSSQARQLAIGWDVRNNPTMAYNMDNHEAVDVSPLKGGPSDDRVRAIFYFQETESGVGMENITDGPLKLQVTRTPVQKIAGKVIFEDWTFVGLPAPLPAMVDGTYRLSMVAAVYNP